MENNNYQESQPEEINNQNVQSIQDLIDVATGKKEFSNTPVDLQSTPTFTPLPFTALAGQTQAKLGLILALISPNIRSILLSGPSASGKSSLILSLKDIFPDEERSHCQFGCLASQIEESGFDAVCAECATKYGLGQPISENNSPQIIEYIPGEQKQFGFLRTEDQLKTNCLFIKHARCSSTQSLENLLEEINSLSNSNPGNNIGLIYEIDENYLDEISSILPKFDLFLQIDPLPSQQEKIKGVTALQNCKTNNLKSVHQDNFRMLRSDILKARQFFPEISIPFHLQKATILLTEMLQVDSIKAEYLLLEVAKAAAAADFREVVSGEDISSTAKMVLRQFLKIKPEFLHKSLSEIDQFILEKTFNIFPK